MPSEYSHIRCIRDDWSIGLRLPLTLRHVIHVAAGNGGSQVE